MRRALVLAGVLGACSPTPSVVLEFPDPASQQEAAAFTVAALPANADCAAALATGAFSQAIQVVTGSLPLGSPAHLGIVPRGQTLFFAEVRDSAGRAFLRACTPASSGGEVVLSLQRVNRPPDFSSPDVALQVNEGKVLTVDVQASDPDGTPVTLAVRDLPVFCAYDPQQHRLTFTPSFIQSGTYPFSLDATEQREGGVTTTRSVTLTVSDVQRPLQWSRLYRGWHGRFDAAALWDGVNQQLITSGGRDFGLSNALPTLFLFSLPPDVLTDYHALSMDVAPAVWNRSPVTRATAGGKFQHVMGYVTSEDTHTRLGFVLGGNDGAQISSEALLMDLNPGGANVMPPLSVVGMGYFLEGMAAAVEPGEQVTYLFGGDLGNFDFHNQVFRVRAPTTAQLLVEDLTQAVSYRPPLRSQAAAVIALNPKRLVVIGGRALTSGGMDVHFDDAWVLCLEAAPPKCPQALAWSRVAASGDPFPGSNADGVFALAAGYDPGGDRVITYGGLGVVGGNAWIFEDAFALDLSASAVVDAGIVSGSWKKLPAPGGPLGLTAMAVAPDPDGGRVLLYGGVSGRIVGGAAQLDLTEDVWQLGVTAGNEKLTKVAATGLVPYPQRRTNPVLTTRGDPLLLGGQGEDSDPTDQWLVRDGGVEGLVLAGVSPLPRAQMSLTYNPDLDEYWAYGGRIGQLRPNAALYRLEPDAGWLAHDLNSMTESRFAQAQVYDSVNHRLVVFGGLGGPGALADVTTLALENGAVKILPLAPTGAPPEPRYGAVAGYDRAGQRMIVFGGTKSVAGSELDNSEVWQLSLAAGHEEWKHLVPTGDAPASLYLPGGALTAEDPPVLYVVGTVTRQGLQPGYVDRLWKLTLQPGAEHWSDVVVPDFHPRPRLFPATAYDAQQHRLLLSSGAADPVYRNDVWALTLP